MEVVVGSGKSRQNRGGCDVKCSVMRCDATLHTLLAAPSEPVVSDAED